jgi:hypothetical protein
VVHVDVRREEAKGHDRQAYTRRLVALHSLVAAAERDGGGEKQRARDQLSE